MSLLDQPGLTRNIDTAALEDTAVIRGGSLLASAEAEEETSFRAGHFLESLSYALEGLIYATRTQRNFKIHLGMAAIALSMAVWLQIGLVEWALLWGVIGLVLFAELANTILELFVDLLVGNRYDTRAKAIKDMAAGAVLVTALTALACGVCIFVPHLIQAFGLV